MPKHPRGAELMEIAHTCIDQAGGAIASYVMDYDRANPKAVELMQRLSDCRRDLAALKYIKAEGQ